MSSHGGDDGWAGRVASGGANVTMVVFVTCTGGDGVRSAGVWQSLFSCDLGVIDFLGDRRGDTCSFLLAACIFSMT